MLIAIISKKKTWSKPKDSVNYRRVICENVKVDLWNLGRAF